VFEAAKAWDVATLHSLLRTSAELAQAADPKGRTALHLACSVKPSARQLGEPNGIKTVTVLLEAGAGLEVDAPLSWPRGAVLAAIPSC
jgi:ankyrin repeat protein